MSKFISSSNEIRAFSKLALAVIDNLPGNLRKAGEVKLLKSKLNELGEDIDTLKQMSLEDINTKYGIKEGYVSFYVNDDREFVFEINEDYVIGYYEILEDEVPTLVGIGVTIAGAMMLLKSRLKSISDKLEKLAAKFN